MASTLGMNEGLILAVLESGERLRVAEVASRLIRAKIGRDLDDGSIYMALTRMATRGFVSVEKDTVLSADGRHREVGFFAITPLGSNAVSQFAREANAALRLAKGLA